MIITRISSLGTSPALLYLFVFSILHVIQYFILLSFQNLGGRNHAFLVLIRECLNNAPSRRPDAREILRRLNQFRVGAEGDQVHMDRLELMEQLQVVQKDLADLQVKLRYFSALNDST